MLCLTPSCGSLALELDLACDSENLYGALHLFWLLDPWDFTIDVFSMLLSIDMNSSSTHESLVSHCPTRRNVRGSGEYRMAVASANSQVRKPRICENG